MKSGTYKHTPERIAEMRTRKHTPETKAKIAAAHRGLKRPDLVALNLLRRGSKTSDEIKLKMSRTHKSIGTKPPSWSGKKHTAEWRTRHAERQKGSKSHFWMGGLTEEHTKQRNSVEYKLWREAVYKRDGFKCVLCGNGGKQNLNADHIKSFSKHPELRFEVSNGRTLCVDCHKKTPNYGIKAKKVA